jgi:hypothetical protein
MEVFNKSSGRPKVFDDGDLASATEAMADGVLVSGPMSRRQMQNRLYALVELGRIRDLEKFDAAVASVLEHRPKTKEAVARIRLFRTGKSRSPNARELAEEIARAVNGYGTRYPELTREQGL